MKSTQLLQVEHLKKYFPIKGGILQHVKGYVKAVDDVSFYLTRGETLGLVGESGCGKTTVARTVLKLLEPTSGRVIFDGTEITNLSRSHIASLRRRMQIVFQDPYASLNPRMTIKENLSEPILINRLAERSKVRDIVLNMLRRVGLSEDHLYRFPHEFSGGQRQRICVARALVTSPELIILDEPTSSLDVSVQSQILNLLRDIQHEYQLSYLFISHNLSVIRNMTNTVAVMYLGKIVEVASTSELYANPLHPYTRALISNVPRPKPHHKIERIVLPGDVPSPANPPLGCRFHPRCPLAFDRCGREEPELREISPSHFAACHLY